MIGVVYGTTGELIKLSPVLMRLRERGRPAFTLCTGQQVEQIPALLDDFGLPQPDLWLSRGRDGHDLARPIDLPPWLGMAMVTFARQRRKLRARMMSTSTRPLLVVHGDTFTAVLGSAIGHVLRVPVAHIEAGVRSGSWRDPFPEEPNRLIIARLAHTHFAPGAQAVANLRAMKARGEIVDTGGNTIRDAITQAPGVTLDIELPPEPFGLVSLRRFELLSKPSALRAIIELLHEVSRSTPILFIDHSVTVAAIDAHGLDPLFDDRLRHVPRQRYFRFIALLKKSEFLVTDSGGSEQECAHLGHPCLVHRAVTESGDGLSGSVVLSRMDLDVVRTFLEDPQAYVTSPTEDRQSPTNIIIEHLESHGYLAPLQMHVAIR